MKKSYKLIVLFLMAGLSSLTILAQQNITITGSVKSSLNSEIVPAVSVLIKGKTTGTFTDDKGNFRITTNAALPLTLVFSSVGFADKEVTVSSATAVSVSLDPTNALAQDVVVSASRVPERILESPVSIERINSAAVRNTAQSNYYDMIGNLKGVDLVTSSLLFKTPTTRGFNTSGNLRLNQLVDGMDNQAPGLNFAVGNLVGLTELDVDNIELLGGASSALYGPGGMNGTLLINGKNPFKYQGLSWQVKQGVMHTDRRQRNASPYFDWTLRYAKQVTDKFAFKIGGQFIQTRDWIGTDYSNYTQSQTPISGRKLPGTRSTDANYNGVNVYGDETTANLRAALTGPTSTIPAVLGAVTLPGFGPVTIPASIALSPFTAGATFDVSRTGYKESEILDPTTQNVKLSGSLNYKITEGIEASFTGHFGLGNTVYTGSDRYSLKGVKIGQYKLEVNHRNWFIRGYTTQEDAGESFNATVTTRLFNEAWKPSQAVWYPQFIGALVGGSANAYGGALGAAYAAALGQGQTPAQAAATAQLAAPNGVFANRQNILNAARAAADVGRPAPGSAQFISIFDQVRSKPISQGGGLFFDKSNLYMTEGQYNLTEVVKFAEVLVGANYKQYVLNSQGTLFADTAGRIKINEVGTYALVSKKLFKDVLKLTASGRYDKNSNFAGKFTPRFSAVVKVAKDNNFRLSYQTAYRFPSTQNQWINLVIGGGVRLLGGLPQLRTHYGFNTSPVYTPESAAIFGANAQMGIINPALLKVQSFDEYKPEQARSYEVGYKGLITPKLLFDVYAYYTRYENFIGRIAVVQSKTASPLGLLTQSATIYSVSVNSSEKVNTQGWGTSVEYLLGNNFVLNANVYSDEIKNVPANFIAGFNTPKVRTNIGLGNTGLFLNKRLGFNVVYRYQDEMKYESDFGSGTIPSFSTVDAQVNYKLPKTKSMVKLGATNLLNKYYLNAFGNPEIGGLYYLSFGYNIF